MKVKITVHTEFGIYNSSEIEIDDEKYDELKDISKAYHLSAFDMELESGGYLIVPPEVISRSVMVITIL